MSINIPQSLVTKFLKKINKRPPVRRNALAKLLLKSPNPRRSPPPSRRMNFMHFLNLPPNQFTKLKVKYTPPIYPTNKRTPQNTVFNVAQKILKPTSKLNRLSNELVIKLKKSRGNK